MRHGAAGDDTHPDDATILRTLAPFLDGVAALAMTMSDGARYRRLETAPVP
jgi:hypothetical protein